MSAAWDDFVRAHPHGHILQTSAWGQLKASFGWQAETIRAGDQGALVLFRPFPLGWTLAYVPRGPLVDWQDPSALGDLIAALDGACRARRALCLKWEPDLPDSPACADLLASVGFGPSPQTVQPRRTIVVDLSAGEADILARMKQKTRYNIGLAAKKEVAARPAQSPADLETFIALMRVTSARDNFGVHSPDYYRQAYSLFRPPGQCELFLAEYHGEALAGVMAFVLGKRAWYFYGASSDRERNRMAPYLAQWEAMRWAKAQGALAYDLWGVPDADEDVLEAEFETRHDGLWGVYRFKRGWGGKLVRTVGAWDKIYNPGLYQAYLLYLNLRRQSLG
ncbi:MAG TPA: peptidoglycan bridge formation glycyltransferase FemA/FemB family protein [Anaerolineales bacterium]|nr:peptidoglycan bridge formation glycyltransferase FemA/FemB family protein [Anaerolineales bacterium]